MIQLRSSLSEQAIIVIILGQGNSYRSLVN